MSWLSELSPRRRPMLLVEDHLYHIEETLRLFRQQAPDLLPLLTVVCLDRPGPDTERAVRQWLADYPEVYWAASASEIEHKRLDTLTPEAFSRPHELSRTLAKRLRPGGLILQDVQLETLTFIPRDRWWESIYVAASIRGLFADRPPCCRFLSNKKGYEATFGVDLLEAGFDPRDVLDKRLLDRHLIPIVRRYLGRRFPFDLRARLDHHGIDSRVGFEDGDRAELEESLDLVLWDVPGRPELGGRAVAVKGKRPRLALKPGGAEPETWRELIRRALDEPTPGLPVLDVGTRVAPELAGRAEITNCAARHIHGLRSRLQTADAIQTVEHAYRLKPGLSVGWIAESSVVD